MCLPPRGGIGEADIVGYQFGFDVLPRVEEHIARFGARNGPLTRKNNRFTQKRPGIAAGPLF
jgi:hypothetical protein